MSCESYPQPQYQEKDLTSSDKTSNFQDHDATSSPEFLEHNQISQLEQIINQGTDEEFQKIVPEIPVKLNNPSYKSLIRNKMLHLRLIKLFYKVIKNPNLQKESQQYPLFLLSLLAELVRYDPSIKLPFTKKIVVSMLSVNIESIQGLKQASKIIQILSILMGNMSQQGRLMIRLGVVEQLWKSLALLYSKTDDLFALRILLKAFLDIASTTQLALSSQDATMRDILSKVGLIFGLEKANKLKMMLLRPKSKCFSQATLWELVTKRK